MKFISAVFFPTYALETYVQAIRPLKLEVITGDKSTNSQHFKFYSRTIERPIFVAFIHQFEEQLWSYFPGITPPIDDRISIELFEAFEPESLNQPDVKLCYLSRRNGVDTRTGYQLIEPSKAATFVDLVSGLLGEELEAL